VKARQAEVQRHRNEADIQEDDMKMAKLYEATGALVAGMDKKKAAKQAASVAFAVANGNGAPHMRVVARVVAHTLTVIGDRQPDGASAVTPALDSGPAPAPAAGWEQAIRAVQELRQAGSDAQTAARDNVAVAPRLAQGSTVKPGGPVTDGWQQAVKLLSQSSPGSAGPVSNSPPDAKAESSAKERTISRGVLTGQYDAANIGAFSFNLYRGIQLQVNMLRASGNVGGQFWIADLQPMTWHRLKDRSARLLPVWIRVNGPDVETQVGDGPGNALVLQATDMLHRSTLGG
jgi:hypothetical protein